MSNYCNSLHMSNYCNSVALSEYLLANQVHTVGALNADRGEPPVVRNPVRMNTGDVVSRDNGKVLVLAWKNKRIVKAITTKHDASVTFVSRRKRKGGGQLEWVSKPVCIVDYNRYVSGVNLMDQMIAYYPFTRKSTKWTKKVFFYLLEISIHNAYVLYTTKCNMLKHDTLLSFTLEIVGDLCRSRRKSQRQSADDDGEAFGTSRPRGTDPPERLRGGFLRHELTAIPPTAKKTNPQKRCRACWRSGVRKGTRYYCIACDVPLCCVPCYRNYHCQESQEDFLRSALGCT